ncbi:MAG: hypothetical protein ACJ8OJ_19565 [Povalibacter sp.]
MSAISTVVRQMIDRHGVPLALCRMPLDFASGDSRRPTTIVFEFSLGGKSLGEVAVPAAKIGVPLRFSEARSMRNWDYRIPDELIRFVNKHLPDARPLYLAFDSPYGYLPAVQWELLATSALGRPIVRMGATSVRPVLPEQTMDVAYCCSLPSAAGISPAVVATEFIRQLPRELPEQARLHVFTHRALSEVLQRKIESLGVTRAVTIYTAPEASSCPLTNGNQTLSDVTEVSQIQNPWLLWMRDALKHVSVDVVHFVCTGYLGRTKAGLRLADAPTQTDQFSCAEIVSTREITMFLQQVGAWSVVFSSPPFNSCDIGLRMLFHEMAAMVAGPTAFHDIAADTDSNALAMLYRYVFEPEAGLMPSSPALALSTHPAWSSPRNQQWDDRTQRLVRDYTVFGETATGMSPNANVEPAPAAWVTSQQRSLEKSISELGNAPQSDREQAREDGILEALRFTKDLLSKYIGGKSDGTDGSPK